MDEPFVILCGLGFFEIKLLQEVSKIYPTIAIDSDPIKINSLKGQLSNCVFIHADASSILTWKKLDLKNLVAVITTFRDSDVNLEVCRIIRLSFHLDIPLIVISYTLDHQEEFNSYNAKIIRPIDMAVETIISKLKRNYSKAVNIGLGESEIIEVNVLSKSHLTDKKLSNLKPKNWLVAAIYRNNSLVLPNGESVIKVNDKIILVGNPKILESIANIFLKGIPQFPMQYGQECVVLENQNKSILNEALYLADNLYAKSAVFFYQFPSTNRPMHPKITYNENLINKVSEILSLENDIGLYILPHFSDFFNIKLKFIVKHFPKPFLISKGAFPYDGIIAVLNSFDMQSALETTIELSKIFNLDYRVLLNIMPDNISSLGEKLQIRKAAALVRDFESVYKTKIHFKTQIANPIRGTIEYASKHKNHLLVLNYNKKAKISFFNPHIAYSIIKKAKNSVLSIPL